MPFDPRRRRRRSRHTRFIPFFDVPPDGGIAGSDTFQIHYSRCPFPSRKRARAALSACAVFVNGMVGGYGTLMSDGYPTAARDRAERAGEYRTRGRRLGPVAVGALAARYSFQTAIALLAGLYVLDMVATLFLIPELKGVELE